MESKFQKTSSIAVKTSRSTTQSDSIVRQTNKRSSYLFCCFDYIGHLCLVFFRKATRHPTNQGYFRYDQKSSEGHNSESDGYDMEADEEGVEGVAEEEEETEKEEVEEDGSRYETEAETTETETDDDDGKSYR